MSTPQTRVDPATLKKAVSDAKTQLDALETTLGALLVTLTDADRATMPRVRTGFPAAARGFADLMGDRPDIAAVTGFDAAAVTEDLDNVEAIGPLLARLEALARRVTDSRLQWLAEAQEPTLAAYSVAKVRATRDGTLASMLAPLGEVLSNSRRKAAAT